MLTVLMATYNGAETLADVLAAYRCLESPPGGWNLIVVDNRSTDRTKDLVESFASALPLTYLFEATPGKNAALNAGLPLVTGDLVVFADDDAVPRPNWLGQLRSAADAHPDFALCGGRIIPRWLVPPPDWVLRWVPQGPAFGLSPPLPAGPVDRRWVYGANMAVRRAVFDLGYRFDPTIGPRGTSYAQGSEAELTWRLQRAGFKAWFCPDAVVEHIIQPHQLTEAWILGRARRYGRGRYRITGDSSSSAIVPVLGVPLRLALSLATQTLRVLRAWVRRDPEAAFMSRWTWHSILGRLQEARLLHRQRRQDPLKRRK